MNLATLPLLRFPALPAAAIALTLLLSAVSSAQTVYKSVGSDGKITYGERPPADGKVEKTLSFVNLPATPLPESVVRYRAELQKSMQNRLADAGKPFVSGETVFFMAQWCGYCKQAKRYMDEKKITYREYDIDTPAGMQAFAATGKTSGVPVLLAKGQKVQGYSKAAYDMLFGVSP